jgi:hypothetical protein
MAKQTEKGPIKQIFNRLIGMISVYEQSDTVGFEFGEKGLLFSDAVRKEPLFTLNGKDFDGYGVIAGDDGKLYLPQEKAGYGTETGKYYVLGSWTKPADMDHIAFRQKCEIKIDVPYTYVVKKPLNPMAHITFVIDLKQAPPLVDQKPAFAKGKAAKK